ncbi:MAG: hypothetical protein NXI32_15680 [bacterium]|nr:hypothetical protein [bacterium]
MSIQQRDGKSCESQLLDEQPNEAWDVERLGEFARARHQEIDADEQSLARAYWQLGLALNLARRQFSYGQWAKFLDELGIDKTRASKARAIQRSFDTENSVDGLSVQEAYRKRKRKSRKVGPKKKRRKSTNEHERISIAEWLRDVCQQIDIFLDEVASTDTEDAANVLPAIDAAVEELNRLRSQVQQRIGAQ